MFTAGEVLFFPTQIPHDQGFKVLQELHVILRSQTKEAEAEEAWETLCHGGKNFIGRNYWKHWVRHPHEETDKQDTIMIFARGLCLIGPGVGTYLHDRTWAKFKALASLPSTKMYQLQNSFSRG